MSLLHRYENCWRGKTVLSQEERVVFDVLGDLEGRSGFDDWWGQIDGDTQEEILQELVKLTRENLKMHPGQ